MTLELNRRLFSKMLLAAPLACAQDSVSLEIGGSLIDVSLRGDFEAGSEAILSWVRMAAQAVTAYFGRYPVQHARVQIIEGRRRGVSGGRSFGENGAHCRIAVGRETTLSRLKDDWMLTHEMVHFGFPSVEDQHHWIEEGSATYIEPIARAKAGELSPERVWGDMVRDMWQGLPEAGDEGLDHTHTWGRTYWGGALFCLLADVEIRQRTQNKKGLEDAIRAINRAGGNIETEWPLTRAFEIGDRATGTRALMDLYQQMSSKPVATDLTELWAQLGVRREGGAVVFDDNARLAAIRSAICG